MDRVDELIKSRCKEAELNPSDSQMGLVRRPPRWKSRTNDDIGTASASTVVVPRLLTRWRVVSIVLNSKQFSIMRHTCESSC